MNRLVDAIRKVRKANEKVRYMKHLHYLAVAEKLYNGEDRAIMVEGNDSPLSYLKYIRSNDE